MKHIRQAIEKKYGRKFLTYLEANMDEQINVNGYVSSLPISETKYCSFCKSKEQHLDGVCCRHTFVW